MGIWLHDIVTACSRDRGTIVPGPLASLGRVLWPFVLHARRVLVAEHACQHNSGTAQFDDGIAFR
jgi:hypothetical protein